MVQGLGATQTVLAGMRYDGRVVAKIDVGLKQNPAYGIGVNMDNEFVASDWHGHLIAPWAVEEKCYFCKYPASHKVTEDYTGPFHPLTAYVCCNHFWSRCMNDDLPRCPRCRHGWVYHETEFKLYQQTVYECGVNVGMGDWCGCKEAKP